MITSGTIIVGAIEKYRINRFVDKGGVGNVYLATGITSGDRVAIKIPHSDRFSHTDVMKARFANEIRATMVNKGYKFIVKGVDTGETNNEPFLALEWMDGGTLKTRIERRDYDQPQAVRWAAHLLKAFGELLKISLVHRDIKPNNVLLNKEGIAKLADLGVAKMSSGSEFLTISPDQIGSVLYISENQRRRPADAHHGDDFYSLCLVLYELATGTRVHTRNVSLSEWKDRGLYLPKDLCDLIDSGLSPFVFDWRAVYEEMIRVVDLDGEIVRLIGHSTELLPARAVGHRFDDLLNQISSAAHRQPSFDEYITHEMGRQEWIKTLSTSIASIRYGFSDAAKPAADRGVFVRIVCDPELDGVYDFDSPIVVCAELFSISDIWHDLYDSEYINDIIEYMEYRIVVRLREHPSGNIAITVRPKTRLRRPGDADILAQFKIPERWDYAVIPLSRLEGDCRRLGRRLALVVCERIARDFEERIRELLR